MKKRLVFAFSVFDGCLDNRGIKLHLNCLRHYCDVFDEAVFVLTNEDADDSTVLSVKKELTGIPFKDIRIKMSEKSFLYESQVFYDEVVSKFGELDCLVFFGHTKGVSNYWKKSFAPDNIDIWIEGSYYLGLSNIDYMEYCLIKLYTPRFYGSFLSLTKGDTMLGDDFMYYQGNFFWLNPGRIQWDITKNKVKLPLLYDRWYAEYFPGRMYDGINGELCGLNDIHIYSNNKGQSLYFNAKEAIDFILNEQQKEEFKQFKTEIENGV